MKEPIIIVNDSFQNAWLLGTRFLKQNSWEYYNLIVQITDPSHFNQNIHDAITDFANGNNLLTPKQVAYTIFPYNQYKGNGSSQQLYDGYMRKFYPCIGTRWGTYFHRMINYERGDTIINQLENIINAINNRVNRSKAAFTISIQYPGNETIRKQGGPCLNYIAVQIKSRNTPQVGLLAVYRNHDFLRRTYGNYFGLCKLLSFISEETNMNLGPLTCISSHAYVDRKKSQLSSLINSLNGNL